MLPVEEGQNLILENAKVLDSVEVSLTEADGLVLAEDIISLVNLPYLRTQRWTATPLRAEIQWEQKRTVRLP